MSAWPAHAECFYHQALCKSRGDLPTDALARARSFGETAKRYLSPKLPPNRRSKAQGDG